MGNLLACIVKNVVVVAINIMALAIQLGRAVGALLREAMLKLNFTQMISFILWQISVVMCLNIAL